MEFMMHALMSTALGREMQGNPLKEEPFSPAQEDFQYHGQPGVRNSLTP